MVALSTLFGAFGLAIFVLGLQGLVYFPLTIAYEIWKRRTLRGLPPYRGVVSVIMPAFNEERTIRVAVETLLESEGVDLDVIVVDDGSTDRTTEMIEDLQAAGRLRLIRQANAGKAAALNTGIAAARGDIVVYTDADSLFFRDTVAKLTRWFADPSIDAVCGNDMPLRAGTSLQKLLVVTTHVGTGYVRRALSILGCLPIISGNLGAIRRSVLVAIGGFAPTWGEDLEITWRLHLRRKRIVFDPEPVVLADCPSTFDALWKQRVRWVRSYLKVSRQYWRLSFRRSLWPFSFYAPVNFANMAIVPVMQATLVLLLPIAFTREWLRIDGLWQTFSWLGLVWFFVVAVYGIVLDRDYRDLRYVPWGLLIVPVSFFYNAVVIFSWWKEMHRAEEKWEKIRRLGPASAAPRQWAFAVSMIVVAIVATSATWTWMVVHEKSVRAGSISTITPGNGAAVPAFDLSVSTHFDAWPDWRDAIRTLDRPMSGLVDIVGVGAGRVEWTYFRWAGHDERWSNHQKGEPEDLLKLATTELHAKGHRVAAFVDLYSPRWTTSHKDTGAVLADGTPHAEQVGLADLADGEFGGVVIEMIDYLAANYDIDAIDITETAYRNTSFGPHDLASYRQASGRSDWPRTLFGNVDVDDPSIWEWKTTLMERFVSRAADAVHRHGKRLYLDVAVSWTDLTRDGKDYGVDYTRMLKHVDHLVVWDYFALAKKSPAASKDLARRLSTIVPADRWTMSVGLWGQGGVTLPVADVSTAIAAAVDGGARRVWITPSDRITDQCWSAILRTWLVPMKMSTR